MTPIWLILTPVGLPLILHGLDQFVAGAQTVITGESTSTATAGALSWSARQAGASAGVADLLGNLGDAGIGIGLSLGAGLLSKADDALEAAAPRQLSCFPAGTPVATGDGPQPIESVVEGQLVWAYDLVESDWKLRRVLRAYSRRCEGLAASIVVGGETIVSTSRHPYFVSRGEGLDRRPRLEHLAEVPADATTAGRWVDAGDLRVGDELIRLDGRAGRVDRVELSPFVETVYNFEVEDLHCYAVGQSGVLVHNNNGPEIPAPNNASPRYRSIYNDGTLVVDGQQPPRLSMSPDPTATGPHSRIRYDNVNGRIYQLREFDGAGTPVRDIDFTNPTFPNGTSRPGHAGPPHQHPFNINDPRVGPKSGLKRGGPEPIN